MRQFPKLRPCGWDAWIVLAVALFAVVFGVMVWGQGSQTESLAVVISIDGKEVERCALGDFPDAEQSYTGNGYTLKVALAAELLPDQLGIHVEEADCPTQDCVHTGTITRAGQSIVCLPARIVIELKGDSTAGDGPDIVIG